MRDRNVCACGFCSPFDSAACDACGADLYAPAGGLTLWLLQDTSTALTTKLAKRLGPRFGREVHISPGRVAAGPSRRPRPWKGNSATAFLNQVARRARCGEIVLGIAEGNVVPAIGWNFLFGLAYLGQRCAVMSLHPLRADGASTSKVLARAEAIAVHELGHALGLDHHGYEDDVHCVMVGDVEYDCVEALDAGTAEFCETCARRAGRPART